MRGGHRRTTNCVIGAIALIALAAAAPAGAAPGSLDDSFDADGFVLTDLLGADSSDEGAAVAAQEDGKVIVAGHASSAVALARYRTSGKLDPKFSHDGVVKKTLGPGGGWQDVQVLGNGKIVAVGDSHLTDKPELESEVVVGRYLANGKPDKRFAGDGIKALGYGNSLDRAFGVVVTGGKVVVVGDTNSPGAGFDFALARLSGKGKLDKSFGDGGKVVMEAGPGTSNDTALGVVANDDGSIVVAGDSDQAGSGTDFTLARYDEAGELDEEFDGDSGTGNGIVSTPVAPASGFDQGSALALGNDGRLVVAGRADVAAAGHNFAVARYLADGTLDDGFAGDGTVITGAATAPGDDQASAVVSLPDGSVIAGGEADVDVTAGVNQNGTLVRYTDAGVLDPAFDGDSGTGNGVVTTQFGPSGPIDRIAGVALSGEKLIAGGTADSVGPGGHRDFLAARYLLTGP